MLGPAAPLRGTPTLRPGPGVGWSRVSLSRVCCSLGKRSSEGNHSSLVPVKQESRPWSKSHALPKTFPTAGPLPASRDAETSAGVKCKAGQCAAVDPEVQCSPSPVLTRTHQGPAKSRPLGSADASRAEEAARCPLCAHALDTASSPLPSSKHGCCRTHRSNLWT